MLVGYYRQKTPFFTKFVIHVVHWHVWQWRLHQLTKGALGWDWVSCTNSMWKIKQNSLSLLRDDYSEVSFVYSPMYSREIPKRGP